MTVLVINNNAEDAIASLSIENQELLKRLNELESDNLRLKRMVKGLNQKVAFTSNLNEVYARMIESNKKFLG